MRLADVYLPPIAALVLAMMAINSADVIRKWWEGKTPAVEWRGVEVITKEVKPGGQIEAIYTAVVHRQCPSDIRGFILDSDGSVPVRFPVLWGGYTEPSDKPIKVRVSVTMPRHADAGLEELKSGPHIYRTLVTRYCPHGTETDNKMPDVPFYLEVSK